MTIAADILSHTKIIKDLNDFSKKLHDISSKVENLRVCLKKVLSGAIEENMESVEAAENI